MSESGSHPMNDGQGLESCRGSGADGAGRCQSAAVWCGGQRCPASNKLALPGTRSSPPDARGISNLHPAAAGATDLGLRTLDCTAERRSDASAADLLQPGQRRPGPRGRLLRWTRLHVEWSRSCLRKHSCPPALDLEKPWRAGARVRWTRPPPDERVGVEIEIARPHEGAAADRQLAETVGVRPERLEDGAPKERVKVALNNVPVGQCESDPVAGKRCRLADAKHCAVDLT
jgi:hypothetical protein